MVVRLEHKYNHHYSDMHDDSGIPIGTIMCVFVDTNGNGASAVANNYPGWIYCDGSQHNVNDYPMLYDIIGDKYVVQIPAQSHYLIGVTLLVQYKMLYSMCLILE